MHELKIYYFQHSWSKIYISRVGVLVYSGCIQSTPWNGKWNWDPIRSPCNRSDINYRVQVMKRWISNSILSNRRRHLLGDAADSRSLHLSLCIQEDVVRDSTDAILLHLRRPLAVVHVQEHEVDLVLELLLHRESGGNLLLANLTPAGIESASSSPQQSET